MLLPGHVQEARHGLRQTSWSHASFTGCFRSGIQRIHRNRHVDRLEHIVEHMLAMGVLKLDLPARQNERRDLPSVPHSSNPRGPLVY